MQVITSKTSPQTLAPIIRLVDDIVQNAIAHKASDIHFESTEKGLRVRFRMDGILYDRQLIEPSLMTQVISRLKVMAHINIAQKRLPQDGKFQAIVNAQHIDLRVSTFPAVNGEKIVVRILDRTHNKIALDALGMHHVMLDDFKKLIGRSNGFFLVTGPTGSGKTTTLYAALSAITTPEKNIITLEDPVEYNVAGITQGQVHPEVGFTFAKGIRAILRQDPDILMVGEIRDKETASIAIEAALTGHMVLSTLHTNNAPSVIMRLMDMAIEPFLINAVITGVLAQRLARKICVDCKIEYEPDVHEVKTMQKLGVHSKKLYKGQGCSSCLKLGYKGRTGIFELLTMSSALRALIITHPHFEAIYEQAIKDGMHTLLQDGMQKVKDGIITLHELVRKIH